MKKSIDKSIGWVLCVSLAVLGILVCAVQSPVLLYIWTAFALVSSVYILSLAGHTMYLAFKTYPKMVVDLVKCLKGQAV